jgi:hypothetical protein
VSSILSAIRHYLLTVSVIIFGTLTSIFALLALSSRVLQIRTTSLVPTFPVGDWLVSDMGSNLVIAAFASACCLGIGLGVWAFGGYPWAAGLAAGSALSLSAWALLIVGLVEVPISIVQDAVSNAAPIGTEAFVATIQRGAGFTLLVLAAVCGIVTASILAAQLRPDPRGGLNPWVAAIGAIAVLGVALGPLLPVASASVSDNFAIAVDRPALFLIGRLVHLALLAFCGVGGFLIVRSAGLGAAVGSLVLVGWLTVSVALDIGARPIGPGFANPGRFDAPSELHMITLIATIFFFVMTLWAVGGALIGHLASRRIITEAATA